jgi:YHS domain-containing protein
MTAALTLTARYRAAYYGGDHTGLRDLLAPALEVVGPAASYRGLDKFLKASEHVRRMVRSVETRRVFADGDEVCAILEVAVDHPIGSFPLVEWYRVEGDRIASIHTFFDTGPFVRRSAEDAAGAVDPVCHMHVDPEAAPAHRQHGGTRYAFCSEGCAIAFEDDPGKYLART